MAKRYLTLSMMALLYAGSCAGLGAAEPVKENPATAKEEKSLEEKVIPDENTEPFRTEWIQQNDENIEESGIKSVLDDYVNEEDDAALLILGGYGEKSKEYIELPIMVKKVSEESYQLNFMFCGKEVKTKKISDLFRKKDEKRLAKKYDKPVDPKKIAQLVNAFNRTMDNLKIFSIYDGTGSAAADLKSEVYTAYKKHDPEADLQMLYHEKKTEENQEDKDNS